ncbi:10407_t:CDS:2 [Scutellospora calospora]|uniref:10407_t:CDS:1 n=1 Tax=Scutellospora calospora TaxID=85575 RepID=A0ACA9JXE5_9GLOM|nr:10407_t:CDS:2 [Scutellospora calospora]
MQDFINNRLNQQREIVQRLFERLNQNQQRNSRRITVNHRRTVGIQRPRIGRSFIYPRQQRLIGQIENEDNFTNSNIINNFMNEFRNNQNTERQIIRYSTITNIPNTVNDFIEELGIHSNVDNTYLGEARIEPRKSIEENKSIKSNSLQTNYISDVTYILDTSDEDDLFISEEEIERTKKRENKFLSPEEFAEENERRIQERE